METAPSISDMNNVTCPNCGASLVYKPGTTRQVCEYCNSSFEINIDAGKSGEAGKEHELEPILFGKDGQEQAVMQAYVVKCPACGAESAMEKNVFSSACAFCGSPLTVQPDARSISYPQAVLPFKIDKRAASGFFNTWIRRLWFAPNDLKKLASSDRFNGIYLPFWTFDAETFSEYSGRRGDHYTEEVRRVVNGKTETMRVVKTRWSNAWGKVQRAFNDILVTASRALPGKYLNALEPWDLANIVPYDNRFLSGFKAEVCQTDIKQGFEQAKQVMAAAIQQDVRRDIGGDEQQILTLKTSYGNTSYKYILLPVWLSVFHYGSKVYRFVVNARTGEVLGERPYSAIKIILAVLAAILVITLAITIFGTQ